VTAQLRALEEAGVGHVILSSLPQHLDAVLEGVGRQVLPQLTATPASSAS
jgi:hypothetical protein